MYFASRVDSPGEEEAHDLREAVMVESKEVLSCQDLDSGAEVFLTEALELELQIQHAVNLAVVVF